MILNQTNINNAITQASCCMATKATKYYNGLALGKDNMCLFKEVQLLQKYIDILQCFEIVGSTTTCECSIVGEYISNEIPYQFLSDGTGSYFNPELNIFTWNYANGILYLTIEEVTSEYEITFDESCDFSYHNPETLVDVIFTNLNPCTPEVIKQTCLTNKQVTNIIKNINKICKIC